MNLRWLIFDYADPKLSLSPAERRQIRKRAWQLVRQRRFEEIPASLERSYFWSRIGGTAIACLTPGAASLAAQLAIPVALGWWRLPAIVIVQILLSWLGIAIGWRLIWKPNVNRALREHGYEVCLGCGYWLRGLRDTDRKCPECGLFRYRHKPRFDPVPWDHAARLALRREGYDACLDCGAVHKLTEKQCPECGAEREAISKEGGL